MALQNPITNDTVIRLVDEGGHTASFPLSARKRISPSVQFGALSPDDQTTVRALVEKLALAQDIVRLEDAQCLEAVGLTHGRTISAEARDAQYPRAFIDGESDDALFCGQREIPAELDQLREILQGYRSQGAARAAN